MCSKWSPTSDCHKGSAELWFISPARPHTSRHSSHLDVLLRPDKDSRSLEESCFGLIILTIVDTIKINIFIWIKTKVCYSTFRHPWHPWYWPLASFITERDKDEAITILCIIVGRGAQLFSFYPSVSPSPPITHWNASSSQPIGCWLLTKSSDWMARPRRKVSYDGKMQVNTHTRTENVLSFYQNFCSTRMCTMREFEVIVIVNPNPFLAQELKKG